MSKMSELFIQEQERLQIIEDNNQQSPAQPEATFKTERQIISDIKKKLSEQVQEIKTTKLIVYKCVVEKIELISEKYGFNYRITSGSAKYYFNCKTKDLVYKMFEKDKVAVFTAVPKSSRSGIFLIIQEVLYSF